MKTTFICPVCGYSKLDTAPLVYKTNNKTHYSYTNGAPTFTICSCCGTEFGYDDDECSWEDLRAKWIKKGAIWQHKRNEPKKWDFRKQLLNIAKIKKEVDKEHTKTKEHSIKIERLLEDYYKKIITIDQLEESLLAYGINKTIPKELQSLCLEIITEIDGDLTDQCTNEKKKHPIKRLGKEELISFQKKLKKY